MLITNITDSVKDDLDKVNKLIMSSLHSDVALIQEVGNYIIRGGGKRLRPMLVLICAKAFGHLNPNHIIMATVIEFIHTATLLHDDVVDGATRRRNLQTANSKWGNQTAVLVGDFLYSRAFQLMMQTNNLEVLRIIANATNTIAEGEVLQLLHQHDPNTTESKYLHVIRCKTAKLFEAAAEVSAVLNKVDKQQQSLISQFGLHLGTAYQLIDDLLDYQANDKEFGKQLGADLAEGKPTMPILYLLHHGNPSERQLIIKAITSPAEVVIEDVQHAINTSGALKYTQDFAKREATLAKQLLQELPSSEYIEYAMHITDFIVERTY